MAKQKPTDPAAGATGAPAVGLSVPLSDESVTAFSELFEGYSKAHGRYDTSRVTVNDVGKVQGKAITARGKPTLEDYRGHLLGTGPGLGIIMLRDNATVSFGAIDLDDRTMNHVEMSNQVATLELPLVLCRSKSGGGHFYCFVTEPVPAELMRKRLTEWAALLGMSSTTEIFPKQSYRYNETDLGSWINLPYYRASETDRYAVVQGQRISLEVFLQVAMSSRVTASRLEESSLPDTGGLFENGPPCLQMCEAQGGFAEGTRNEGMFAVGVYLRHRFPDNWRTKLDEYNESMAKLPSTEIVAIGKSLSRKSYAYPCKHEPIASRCQRTLCRQRKFGVRSDDATGDNALLPITSVTRYESSLGDDPFYVVEIDGRRVQLSHDQLYSVDEFNKACMAQANLIPANMSKVRWQRGLGALLASATIVPLPEDAGTAGQLWQHIIGFCTQYVQAQTREEVWAGKPYRKDDKVYFRGKDLLDYLKLRRLRVLKEQTVYLLIRSKGGGDDFWNLQGKGLRVWWIPNPTTEDAPDMPSGSLNGSAGAAFSATEGF